ncbi:MAG: MBL fold metallo-hydrolase [Clostridia bacterium]|nr:MBL fold metallo-hydrolase [Clostridia bacterium]
MKLTALQYGTTEIHEGMAFPNGDRQKKRPIALLFFLLEVGERKLLIDVGCDTMPGYPLYTFQSPVAVLEAYGVGREEITDVFLTHSHHDHADALRYYPQATVHLHAAAVERAKRFLPAEARLQPFEEEYCFAEGVRFCHIGGHAAGSSVALIEGAAKTVVLCGDECYLSDNLRLGIPTGSSVDPEKSAAFVAEYRKACYQPILFHDAELVGEIGHKILI